MPRITSIFPYNFRNLVSKKTQFDSPLVLFIGPNGQGKTNFLEALYFLCFASSFRTKSREELRRHGESDMAVNGEIIYQGEEKSSISILWNKQKKEILLDNKLVYDRKEIISLMPIVVFVHGDIEFISGGPEKRRRFLDQTISLLDPLYMGDLRRFFKVLQNRNKILKEENIDLLAALDEELVDSGLPIQRRREEAVSLISDIFSDLLCLVSGNADMRVTIEYKPSWKADDRDAILKEVRSKHRAEFILGSSQSGPHRDGIRFMQGKNDFRHCASTGQLRLASLVLRSTQAQLTSRFRGTDPILLLDDVLLELDSSNRKRFLQNIPAYSQSFFTFLPDEQYRNFDTSAACHYTVKDGEVVAL